jgi:hypothetical protein
VQPGRDVYRVNEQGGCFGLRRCGDARWADAIIHIGRADKREEHAGLLLALVVLLVLIGIIGGVAITKFLFFALVVAALVALIGFFARTA